MCCSGCLRKEKKEDDEGQDEVEREEGEVRENAHGCLCGWNETQEHLEP